LYQNQVVKENRERIEVLENTDKSIEHQDLENKYKDLETKYTDLENKYNTLSTELQKIKDLLIFKFGDVF